MGPPPQTCHLVIAALATLPRLLPADTCRHQTVSLVINIYENVLMQDQRQSDLPQLRLKDGDGR